MLKDLILQKYEAKWDEIDNNTLRRKKVFSQAKPIFDRLSQEFIGLGDDVKFPHFRDSRENGDIKFIFPTLSLIPYDDDKTNYCIDIDFETSIIRMDVDSLKLDFNRGIEWLADFLATIKLDLERFPRTELYDKYNNYRFHYPAIDGLEKSPIVP